ncbi:MAG: hypothetical protein GF353_28620 [Candidatus Lokiarchaeota archaeon]|nr:hypothetical protein [Candidatus Lokiarchaeota archaeon]MBD3353967.1 hypothetical protein [Candidatus Lokiarchaeota archaeon]
MSRVTKSKRNKLTLKKRIIIILIITSVIITFPLMTLLSAGPLTGSNILINFSNVPDGIVTEIGERSITSIETYDVIHNTNTTTTTALVKGHAAANFYSKFSTKQVYQEAEKKWSQNTKYVEIERVSSPTFRTGSGDSYYCRWEYYDLGRINTQISGIDGNVQMDVKLVNLEDTNDIKQSGLTITSDGLTATTRKVTITDSYDLEIGEYSDYWARNMQPVEFSVTDVFDEDTIGSLGDTPASDVSELQALGVYPSGLMHDATVQQGKKQAPTIGNDYVMQSGFEMSLVPDVKVKYQNVRLIKRDYVLVDVKKNFWDVRAGIINEYSSNIVDKTYSRVIGWHVKNYQIHVEFAFEFFVETTLSINIEDSGYNLEDVRLYLENYYWSTAIGGESVNVPYEGKSNTELWWEQNWLFVIIGIAVAITITMIILKIKFGAGTRSRGRSKSTTINIGSKVSKR